MNISQTNQEKYAPAGSSSPIEGGLKASRARRGKKKRRKAAS